MPEVVCKLTCTIPKRGYVEEGEKIHAASLDVIKHPWLKHFTYNGQDITNSKEPVKVTATEAVAVETVDVDEADVEAALEAVMDEVDGGVEDIVFPKHTGAGWYELSDGSKVQGKDAAKRAEAELSASA